MKNTTQYQEGHDRWTNSNQILTFLIKIVMHQYNKKIYSQIISFFYEHDLK